MNRTNQLAIHPMIQWSKECENCQYRDTGYRKGKPLNLASVCTKGVFKTLLYQKSNTPDKCTIENNTERIKDKMTTKYCKTREEWLNRMKDGLQKRFLNCPDHYEYPDKIRISCGFPANSRGGKAIGQCWTPTLSDDGTFEIFISPEIDKPTEVAATLVHELVHTIVGIDNKHNRVFGQCAREIGLEGKLTSTHAGEKLTAEIQLIINELCGLYPHAILHRPPAKQGTRMIKLVCPDCGYTVRTTSKWIAAGYPTCPCGTEFVDSQAEHALKEILAGVARTLTGDRGNR